MIKDFRISNKIQCASAKISKKIAEAECHTCFLQALKCAIRLQEEEELKRLERSGVITPEESSKWRTPLMVVIKNNGKLRVCRDYTTINKNVEEVMYLLPRVPEILTKPE